MRSKLVCGGRGGGAGRRRSRTEPDPHRAVRAHGNLRGVRMEALDGNAIAGDLFEYFGGEMTTVTGSCRHCGARAQIAELQVYTKAPGMVARCRSCGSVVMVL